MNSAVARTIAAACIALGTIAHAQEFPQRAIKIVDAYPPGGATDVMSRIIGERVSKSLGQPVIVEARPGATGTIGAYAVARAQPDGYTLLIGSPAPNAISASAFTKLPYDVEKDFEPIIVAATVPMLFCVPAGSAMKTPADLIAAGRATDTLNFGSTGVGSVAHLLGEIFNREAGTRYKHVAYKGGAPLGLAVMTGEVQLGVLTAADARQHVRSGKIRCVANAGTKRSAQFPDVPTLAEAGLKNVKADVWLGYLAPARTPKAIVRKLNEEITKAVADPEVKAKLEELGVSPTTGTPEDFAARISADRKMYGEVIKAVGVQLD